MCLAAWLQTEEASVTTIIMTTIIYNSDATAQETDPLAIVQFQIKRQLLITAHTRTRLVETQPTAIPSTETLSKLILNVESV